jgi:hypothetical protein
MRPGILQKAIGDDDPMPVQGRSGEFTNRLTVVTPSRSPEHTGKEVVSMGGALEHQGRQEFPEVTRNPSSAHERKSVDADLHEALTLIPET